MHEANAENEQESGGRLVPLPRRTLDADGNEIGGSMGASPTAAVADLLERTDHLLRQLSLDIESLKEDQAKDRARIEQEAKDRQDAADAAIEQLMVLAHRARVIAEKKARVDVLDDALARKVELDTSVTFDQLVHKIEEEIKFAKGITGAIRLGTIGDLLKQATLRVEHMTKQAERSRSRLLKETEVELKSEGKEARASYEIGMSVVRRDLKALDLALPPSGLAWDDPRWQHWEDWDPLSGLSRWIRLGTYFRADMERFRFPAIVEVPGPRGFVLDVASGARDVAIDAVRSALLRILASVPAGDVRFTFIDPVGLGESVAAFLPLAEYRDDLVDEMVYTTDTQIEEKLLEVNRHIERVIQEHLRNEFDSLEEHNDAVGEVVEPYRVITVFDFPTQLTDRAQQLLRTVIDNGPRCGVFTIMTTAPGAARSNGARWKAMLAGLDVITGGADGYAIQHELAGRWLVDLDAPPQLTLIGADGEPTLFGRIMTGIGEAARQGRSTEASPARVFSLMGDALRLRARDDLPDVAVPVDPSDSSTWWLATSARGIGVPIGRAGSRDPAMLWLDSGARSGALVGGEAGSGTSTILHDAIYGLSMIYSPDELALYLVDCAKGATGFEAYAIDALPHARIVAVEAEREFALSVLEGLLREMTRRTMVLAPHGGERAGIEGYRRDTADDLPRILLVIDGIDRLFAPLDRVSDRAALLLDSLVRQGPSYGIHLLAAAHDIAALERVGRHTFDEVRVRVALACSDEESRRLLGSGDGRANQFSRAGEGVINLFGGDEATAQRFQATAIDPHERGLTLREIRRFARQHGFTRRPQVFEGRAPARLEDSAIGQLAGSADQQAARRMPRVWLGEPTAMGAPVEITMRREAGSNLLIVGRDEQLGQGLIVSALVSAVLGHGRDLRTRVLDLMPLESGFSEVIHRLGTVSPVQLFRRRSLDDALINTLAVVEKRAISLDFSAPPVLFVVNGLGPGAGLIADASVDGFDPVRTFERIVREGPEVGVHTILWSDRLPTLAAQASRATMRAFATRVVMQMPAEDSAMLIDSATASALNDNQALLYDEGAARLTKFRPYLIPPLEFVASLTTGMAAAVDAPTPAPGPVASAPR